MTKYYNRDACSSLEKINKNTVLALLGVGNEIVPGDLIERINEKGKIIVYKAKEVLPDRVSVIENNQTVWYPQSILKRRRSSPKHFLNTINYDDWSIVSFDSRKRIVCVRVKGAKQDFNITITLPILTINSLKY